MATLTWSFSRSSTYQTTAAGDSVDFAPSANTTFPSGSLVTYFNGTWTGALRSNTTSAKTVEMSLQVLCNGSWYTLWTGSQYVVGTGTSTGTNSFSGSISVDYQALFSAYQLTDVRVIQVGDSRFRGYASTCSLSFAYVIPTISNPSSLLVNGAASYSGQTIPLTWTAATLTDTSGTITYYIQANGTNVASTTTTSYTILAEQAKSYTTATTFRVYAVGAGLTSGYSNTVKFTYLSPDKTIAYYDGMSWVNCLLYYNTGSDWVKCAPYYFDDTNWVACSTN